MCRDGSRTAVTCSGADRPGRDPEGDGRVDPAREADDEASAAWRSGPPRAGARPLRSRIGSSASSSRRSATRSSEPPAARTSVKRPTAVAGRDVDCGHRIGQHGRVEALPDGVEGRGPDAVVRWRRPVTSTRCTPRPRRYCGEVGAVEARSSASSSGSAPLSWTRSKRIPATDGWSSAPGVPCDAVRRPRPAPLGERAVVGRVPVARGDDRARPARRPRRSPARAGRRPATPSAPPGQKSFWTSTTIRAVEASLIAGPPRVRADEPRAAAAEYRGRAAPARPPAARATCPAARSRAASIRRLRHRRGRPPQRTGSSSGRPGRSSSASPIVSPSVAAEHLVAAGQVRLRAPPPSSRRGRRDSTSL